METSQALWLDHSGSSIPPEETGAQGGRTLLRVLVLSAESCVYHRPPLLLQVWGVESQHSRGEQDRFVEDWCLTRGGFG